MAFTAGYMTSGYIHMSDLLAGKTVHIDTVKVVPQ